MKTKKLKQIARDGSALLITVGVVTIAAMALAGYMLTVQLQASSVARSQTWNSAIATSEAGVEEAMAMINAASPSIQTSPYAWTNNLATYGWPAFTTNTSMSRTVSGSNSYTVVVTVSNNAPVINSSATVSYNSYPWVFSSLSWSGSPYFLAAIGSSSTVTLSRSIQVQTACGSLFSMGLEAKTNITISGNVMMDSFNSGNPLYSTNGQYIASKAEANCGLASDSDISSAISGSGSVQVYGTIHTGPTGGYSLSGSASIGDAPWVNGGHRGVESGHFYNDMNMNFPDVAAPTGTGLPPGSGSVGGTNYTYIFNQSTLYTLPSISLSGQNKILVSATNVVVYVTGPISMSGQSVIMIAPNASLTLYVGGTANFSGQNLMNANNASQCQVYGLHGCTSVTYSGGSSFIGTLYAPEATYNMSGNSDYYGAAVVKSISKSGTSNFHYDENLKNVGPSTGFYPVTWTETTR